MFPSGRTFIAECGAAIEDEKNAFDVAVLVLGAEVPVSEVLVSEVTIGKVAQQHRLHDAAAAAVGPDGVVVEESSATGSSSASSSSSSSVCARQPLYPAAAKVAQTPCEEGDRLFCIGNPSSITRGMSFVDPLSLTIIFCFAGDDLLVFFFVVVVNFYTSFLEPLFVFF
jgi:hypothetical protein